MKAQLNPHFLFNTLNNIYSLAIVKSDKTAHAVLKLSAIMRYILTETERNLVPLENEVAFIHNYIELQQVRLTEKVQVNFNIEGNTAPLLVAPLIFIPFVENAFKHGISFRNASRISVSLQIKDQSLYFDVYNTIHEGSENDPEKYKSGIGLENVGQRLKLLYPNKHELTIRETGKEYFVHLTLQLK